MTVVDQMRSLSELPWYMEPEKFASGLSHAPNETIRAYAETFVRLGYVVIPNAVPAETCDEILAQFRVLEGSHPELFQPHQDEFGHYPRMINMHLALPGLRRLFHENSEALAIQDLLFGAKTALYTSLFYERGSAQDLHRDTPYFCTRPEYRYFGMWVALEDVTENNGPLYVMEGGHLMDELDREAIATELFGAADKAPAMSDDAWNLYQNSVVQAGHDRGLIVKSLPVKKGSTILWHPQLPHGGFPIQDLTKTRFSLVMHTTPENTPVYHQDVFFNPRKFYPTETTWTYSEENGRKYVDHDSVGIGHASMFHPGIFSK